MSANTKLAKNIALMFLVYFFPKSFSFFLVPVYTHYLTTEEYGISDLIINTSTLIAPFVSLSMPSALLRFTIEDRNNIKPFVICLRFFLRGVVVLFIGLLIVYSFDVFNFNILFFVFFIVFTSVLSDIFSCYTKANEKVKVLTVCGVGSAIVGLLSNIIFIVCFKLGINGFLLATIMGYCFNIVVLWWVNRRVFCDCGLLKKLDKKLQKEMINYGFPLIFSGLSWWLIAFSDRYFVTALCGTAINGLYAVAYKIPIILRVLDNVFGQAWMFSLYDSYKTETGRLYIAKVQSMYTFILCFTCSFLMSFNKLISSFLFSDDFFSAWVFVPFLLLSVALLNSSALLGTFLTLYKKSRISMYISFVACFMNLVLNYFLIIFLENAIGAAIASVLAFLVAMILNLFYGIHFSSIPVRWKRMLSTFAILGIQAINCTFFQISLLNYFFMIAIIILNVNSIVLVIDKCRYFLKR